MGANDIRLDMTCEARPEQYNAFIGDRQVGYLRLRGGGIFAWTSPIAAGKRYLKPSRMGMAASMTTSAGVI